MVYYIHTRTTRHKLEHDLEQFQYLLQHEQVEGASSNMDLFQSTLPNLYRQTLEHLDEAAERGNFDEDNEFYNFQMKDREIVRYYNRALYMPALHLNGGPLLSSRDWVQVEQQWLGEDISYPYPGVVVVDNILSPQTLTNVRKYLL